MFSENDFIVIENNIKEYSLRAFFVRCEEVDLTPLNEANFCEWLNRVSTNIKSGTIIGVKSILTCPL